MSITKKARMVEIGAIFFSLGIFVFDGIALNNAELWPLYCVLFCFTYRFSHRRFHLFLAAICTGLMLLSFLMKPDLHVQGAAIADRLLGIALLWQIVFIVMDQAKLRLALRNSEYAHAETQRVARIGNWHFDCASNKALCSEELYKIFDIEERTSDCVYEAFLSRIASEDRPAVQLANAEARTTGKPFDIEYRIITPNQGLKCIREIGHATKDALGNVVRLHGLAQDITDRNKDKGRLLKDEESWRSLVSSSMDAMLLTAPDGRIFTANPAAISMFGFSEQELIEAGRHAVLDGSDPRLAVALEERGRTGKFRGELTFVRKGGKTFPGEISTVIFTNAYGESRTSMVIRDITERKLAEAALQASEAALRARNDELAAILASTPAITFIAHDRACRHMTSNDAALKLLRLPKGATCSKSALPGERPENFQILKEGRELLPEELPLQRAAATGLPLSNCEYTVVFNDGATRDIAGGAIPLLDDEGNIRGAVGAFLDITERKLSEQKVRRSEASLRELAGRLQRVREEERTLIARTIHDDFGHALTDLKLDLAWVDRRLESHGLSRKTAIRKRLAFVSQHLDELAERVRRLATELRPALLDALGLLAAIEWQARQFRKQTNVICAVEASKEFPTLTEAQSTALFRIFQELLTNVARHACASQVVVRLTALSQRIVLQVEDNGRGVAPEEYTRPTALGLLGVRERATALGGDIHILGQPGQGTTITVSLPFETP